MSTNPLIILDDLSYYYGTSPRDPVVEQNQTYMAYFDGIGGTGPELIDQTAYFIRYIIDTKGNITNPAPLLNITDPQAAPLYNLIDNFEPGKRAVVKLITNDPLLTGNPNDNSLTGIHNITHVGRIVPILISETGTSIQDYLATMSFGSPTVPAVVPNIEGQFQASFSSETISEGNGYSNDTYYNLPYATTLTDYTNTDAWTNSSPEFIILSSSAQTLTKIKVQAKIWASYPQYYDPYTDAPIYDNNILTLQILQNGNPIVSQEFTISSGTSNYSTIESPYVDYEVNDEFKVQFKIQNVDSYHALILQGAGDDRFESRIRFIQEYLPNTSFNGLNAVYAPFFQGSVNEPADNGGKSTLIMTEIFSNLYNSGLTQYLTSASFENGLNFSPIAIPFSDIKSGDFIRFEYNKEQVYTITKVFELSIYGVDTTAVEITPSLTNLNGFNTQTININHFVAYRVINDGTYVVLDIKKETSGNSFTGIIQPEFVSKELTINYDKIITDLTQKGIVY